MADFMCIMKETGKIMGEKMDKWFVAGRCHITESQEALSI